MISIVMNTYKENPKFLIESVNSILMQKDVDIELILSTVKGDSSLDVLKDFNNITYCISDNPGIYNQLNNALNYVSGDWFSYASSNDVYKFCKSKDELDICNKNNKGVCYSAYLKTDKNLNVIKKKKLTPKYKYKTHLTKNFVSDVSLVHVGLLNKYGPFNEDFGNYAFWDFWLRIAEGEGEDVFIYNNKPEWFYRITDNSRHVRRKKNKAWQKRDTKNRKNMLSFHIDKKDKKDK